MDVMKVHMYKNIVIYTEDGFPIIPESITKTINSVGNPLKMEVLKGDPIAMYFYGFVLDTIYGKYEEATEWYKKAAEQGIYPAMNCLALCYISGDGVPKDYNKAIELLEKAALEGHHPSSYVKLGMLYDTGDHVPYSAEKAAWYYERGAELNHPIGQQNIAYDYEVGEGVERNYEKAKYWRRRAAENGVTSSQEWCAIHGVSFNQPNEAVKHITDIIFANTTGMGG